MQHISKEEFADIVSRICIKETSANPDGWSIDNPLWDQCAAVALLVQELFGGMLVKVSIPSDSEFAHMKSHFLTAFRMEPKPILLERNLEYFRSRACQERSGRASVCCRILVPLSDMSN